MPKLNLLAGRLRVSLFKPFAKLTFVGDRLIFSITNYDIYLWFWEPNHRTKKLWGYIWGYGYKTSFEKYNYFNCLNVYGDYVWDHKLFAKQKAEYLSQTKVAAGFSQKRRERGFLSLSAYSGAIACRLNEREAFCKAKSRVTLPNQNSGRLFAETPRALFSGRYPLMHQHNPDLLFANRGESPSAISICGTHLCPGNSLS